MAFEVVAPEDWAVAHVARYMRTADVVEIWAMSRHMPDQALWYSMDRSNETQVALFGGEPVAVFGVASMGDNLSPWLLGTDRITERPRVMLEAGREIVSRYAEANKRLVNFIHWRNTDSLRWVSRLGFKVAPARPCGAYGVLFHEVTRECANRQH